MKRILLVGIILLSTNVYSDPISLQLCYDKCTISLSDSLSRARSRDEVMKIREESELCYEKCNFTEALLKINYK